MARHKKLCDGFADPVVKAFTPTHVHNDPKIYNCRSVCGGKDKPKGSPSKDKGGMEGDLLIIDIWKQGTDSIHNTHVVNTDTISYQTQTPDKCLETSKKENKKKYLDACLKQRQKFTPFVALVERLLRFEAEETLKCIDIRLATKWKEPYSHTCG